MFPEPLYILGFPIRLFGIIAAASLISGYMLYLAEIKRLGIPLKIAPDIAFAVLGMSFVGARVFFIMANWRIYLESPLKMLQFWEGGLVLYGGIMGGLFGGYLYCLKSGQSFIKLCDSVILAISLGLALSRLGCFTAGCCYGKPTGIPWAVTFHNPHSHARPLGVPLHPTQLYAFIFGMLVFFILFSYRKKKKFDGELLLLYLMLISIISVALHWLRADSDAIYLVVPCIVLIVSSALYYRFRRWG